MVDQPFFQDAIRLDPRAHVSLELQQQLLTVHRQAEHVPSPGPKRRESPLFGRGARGEHHDGCSYTHLRVFSQREAQREAVPVGHPGIQQNDVRMTPAGLRERRLPSVRTDDDVPSRSQDGFQGTTRPLLVTGEKREGLALRRRRCRRRVVFSPQGRRVKPARGRQRAANSRRNTTCSRHPCRTRAPAAKAYLIGRRANKPPLLAPEALHLTYTERRCDALLQRPPTRST